MLHTRRCTCQTVSQSRRDHSSRRRRSTALSLAAVTAAPALIAVNAHAADGVWGANSAGSYSWSVASNWSGGVVAGGADALANFNTVDLLGDATIALDSSVTVGNVIFGDTDTN